MVWHRQTGPDQELPRPFFSHSQLPPPLCRAPSPHQCRPPSLPPPSPAFAPLLAVEGWQTHEAKSVRLEHQLVHVPLEVLKSTAHANHHLAEKEIASFLSYASSAVAAPASNGVATVDHLTSLVTRLYSLNARWRRARVAEELQVQRCQAQLDRLAAASAGDDNKWEDMRSKRILVDYMMRMSYYDTTTTKLAEASGIHV